MSDSSLETRSDVRDQEKVSPGDEARESRDDAGNTSPKTKPQKHKLSSEQPSDDGEESSKKNRVSDEAADHTSVVAEHYNSLAPTGFSERFQSRIMHMRNFNNWIKTMMINEYGDKLKKGKPYGSFMRALDMCCGKGGDMLKWRKLNIAHLVCADIAAVSVEQCEERYKHMVERSSRDRNGPALFKTEFIVADCTKVRLREKYKDASQQFDIVSCQFAFHYCFESLPQAECMLKNASECLKPGGYFIGTIPDAYELVSRWQKADGNKFGNEIYDIEFYLGDKTDIPLFGAKYNFHLEEVVDCPEFLVHLPTLKKLALKFGLKLITFERFEDFFERKKGEGKFLLDRMGALETYPPVEGVRPTGDATKDYDHAKEYVKNIPKHYKIGTLSKAEWEACTLYGVFAFEKMKQVWSNDGKPEYVPS